MRKTIIVISFTIFACGINAQSWLDGMDEEAYKKAMRSELGIDASVNARTNGGTVGVGLKGVFKKTPELVFGPSFRFQRNWTSNLGLNTSYNVIGAGAFFNYRYENYLFGGLEIEFYRTPLNFTNITSTFNWVPTLFLSAGFSREYGNIVRVNAGFMYDLINHVNSPMRNGYFIKLTDPETGQTQRYIPIIFRLSFFFPLGSGK